MEIAGDAAASGGRSIRDLPPLKRFKFVGSDLGSAPCLPLPAKKRALPPLPEAAPAPICLPAKKRAYAPPLDSISPACLPAKKRVHVRPTPLEDNAPPPFAPSRKPPLVPVKKHAGVPPLPQRVVNATPSVPAKKRVQASPPEYAAAPSPVPVKSHVQMPPRQGSVVAATLSVPSKKGVQAPSPLEHAAPRPTVPAKKRVQAPSPLGIAAAPLSVPAKQRVLVPSCPEGVAAAPSVHANKRVPWQSPPEEASALAPVCLPANKRVMSQFIPPSPSPSSMKSDGARVGAVKEACAQGFVESGAATSSPRVVNGVEASKCEVQAEVLKKPEHGIDPKMAAPAREEEQIEVGDEEVAAERKQGALVEEDDGILCAVCRSTDGDPSDPIVFCDGCDLMVHATCYGNPLAQSIPDGDWFCSLCSGKPADAAAKKGGKPARPPCRLCPARGGAMKRTTDGAWAHIACALLVPEVFFQDPDGREAIDCSLVPGRRFISRCYICESSRGCALECSQPKCDLGFHVSCGLNGGLCIEYREEKGGGVVAGFCREHTKLWEKQQLTGKYKIVSRGQ
ncbi:hypothetical protein ZWY2020_032534 [Hordeum vulgare]|nr:hypothetical protein ZWY2020_032534 [Hordeum vulgare]